MAQTDEFEADWKQAKPSRLPWILLAAAVLVGAFAVFTLGAQKEDAVKQLQAARDQSDAMGKKNLDLLNQKTTLEKRVSDLERENKLLAERKVEPVKDTKPAPAKPAAKSGKSSKKKK